MIRNSSLRRLSLFALLVFHAVLGSDAHAQISFVQISDPHVFDDTSTTADNRLNNRAAFISCIDKINQQLRTNNAQYKFVVITGDLGLEPLVTGISDREQIKTNLRNGAADFASMLVLSQVHHWVFIPGNNDLLNEEPKNIEYYHWFIGALREATKKTIPDFEIQDLCPPGNGGSGGYQSRSDLFTIEKYTFIGFDDSSFKNSDKNATTQGQKRIDANTGVQEEYVKEVRNHLDRADIVYAYIFYHIPAIDDPNLLKPDEEESLKTRYAAKDQIGGSFFHSAWFVDRKVRVKWHTVVIHPKVRGLFAGHFHDYRKQTYQSLSWLTPDYLPDEVEKLHVCPPLALKYQNGKEEQARGLQEVYLDEGGNVSARIVWLNQTAWSLSPTQDSAADSAVEQLALGQTFEQLERLKEAEAAYAKAAESSWPPTRKLALEALTKLVNKQESPGNKYLRSPFVASTSALWTSFISIIPVLILAVFVYLLGKLRGRNKVKIGPVVDTFNGNAGIRFDHIGALVLTTIRNHFERRVLIRSDFKLPMLVKSQSPEIKEILDTAAPAGLGKLLGWVYTLMQRPRYAIQGIVDSDFPARWLFITLVDGNKRLGKWTEESEIPNFNAERKVAFKALKRLIRHMNP